MTDTQEDNIWDGPEDDSEPTPDKSEDTTVGRHSLTEEDDDTPEEFGDFGVDNEYKHSEAFDSDDTEEQTEEEWPDDFVENLIEEFQNLEGDLAKAHADMANLRSRKRKDLDDQFESGRAEVISNLIPVLDSLAGAKEHGDLTDENPLSAILKSMAHTLEALGLGSIGEVGEDFDPTVHEAMSVIHEDDAEGTKVKEVLQRGYATTEKLLRPALVTVVKKTPQS